MPDLGIEKILEPGDNVIDLPALEPGTLEYICGMGMFYGHDPSIGAGPAELTDQRT